MSSPTTTIEKTTAAANSEANTKIDTNTNSNTTEEESKETQESPRSTTSRKGPIQHPLEHEWALWFHNPSQKSNESNFFQNLNEVYAVSTIEQFWGLYNHVYTPSKLGNGCTYYLFKRGIQPKWEDAACVGGGEWTVNLGKKEIDIYWLHAMLSCIAGGEYGENENLICGVAANVKELPRLCRVSLWIRPSTNDEAIRAIGEKFRESLLFIDTDLSEEEKKQASRVKFQFKTFADQMKYIRKPKFEIPN